jgi:hypothetical protein
VPIITAAQIQKLLGVGEEGDFGGQAVAVFSCSSTAAGTGGAKIRMVDFVEEDS